MDNKIFYAVAIPQQFTSCCQGFNVIVTHIITNNWNYSQIQGLIENTIILKHTPFTKSDFMLRIGSYF
jgi:hypothetical protein